MITNKPKKFWDFFVTEFKEENNLFFQSYVDYINVNQEDSHLQYENLNKEQLLEAIFDDYCGIYYDECTLKHYAQIICNLTKACNNWQKDYTIQRSLLLLPFTKKTDSTTSLLTKRNNEESVKFEAIIYKASYSSPSNSYCKIWIIRVIIITIIAINIAKRIILCRKKKKNEIIKKIIIYFIVIFTALFVSGLLLFLLF